MKTEGIITEFINGRFGKIITKDNFVVEFEKFECDYDFINVDDEVKFDLVKSFDEKLDALNISLVRNRNYTDLEQSFQKQTKITCRVKKIATKGLILVYGNHQIFLPSENSSDIEVDLEIEVYIIECHFGGNVIACLTPKNSYDAVLYFSIKNKDNDSIEFEIVAINDNGLQLSKDGYVGFMPNNHIIPFCKNELEIGQTIFVKILSMSASKGVLLSARNYYLDEVLKHLEDAFKRQSILDGIIEKSNYYYHIVNYQGVLLYLHNSYLVSDSSDSIQEKGSIKFKIIDFSYIREISISNIECTNYGILQKYISDNLFRCIVIKVNEMGMVVSLLDKYIGFLSFKELSDCLPWNFDYEFIKVGSILKVSVLKFDYKGLYLSRLKYKIIERRKNVHIYYSLNQKVELKISQHIHIYGILVKNNYSKGLIPIGNIIPNEVYEQIDKFRFLNFCKNYFKRRSKINCTVLNIDEVNNRIEFGLDFTNTENIEKKNAIISYFNDNFDLKEKLIVFYDNKI